jgi:hypothetical protein
MGACSRRGRLWSAEDELSRSRGSTSLLGLGSRAAPVALKHGGAACSSPLLSRATICASTPYPSGPTPRSAARRQPIPRNSKQWLYSTSEACLRSLGWRSTCEMRVSPDWVVKMI